MADKRVVALSVEHLQELVRTTIPSCCSHAELFCRLMKWLWVHHTRDVPRKEGLRGNICPLVFHLISPMGMMLIYLEGQWAICLIWCWVYYRKTLIFQTPSKKPVAILATHAKEILKSTFTVIVSEIQALLLGELYPIDSTNDGFQFLALHFGWYNKYSETVSHCWFVL